MFNKKLKRENETLKTTLQALEESTRDYFKADKKARKEVFKEMKIDEKKFNKKMRKKLEKAMIEMSDEKINKILKELEKYVK